MHPRLPLLGDPGLVERLLLRDARGLDGLPRRDLGGVGVLAVAYRFLGHGAFLLDPRLLDGLPGRDLGLVHDALTVDLALTDLALRGDPGLRDLAFVGDAGGLDRLRREQRRLFGVLLPLRAFPGQFGALLGTAELDLAFLFEARLLGLLLDVQDALLRFEIACPDLDHRVLLDVVAQLAARLDRLDHGGQGPSASNLLEGLKYWMSA